MKQVIIVRTDLKMKKGKIAAQCCHGAIGAYKKSDKEKIRKWENESCAKIVLKVDNLEDLLELKEIAKRNNIANCLVTDAGRTQIPESTITCLGLGPDEDEVLDKITSTLKLL
ncbi:peptidyl-tRNA hydrolase Pth2 [uncultured Methanobrevibacter sp.]|uniref:peptidyl-tRNA hydrolase Pth2 n=1 Tax=uncultured Methanobrevibacter sp. TaxID=253161 RepID=UPI0025D9E052|nr:peptidyl-tRNA hydrolase Pth2 [uncultured Methanobrevibacter sp.]